MVAPWILWRYLLRDIFLHALLGLFVCTLFLVAQNLLRFLEELLAAGVGGKGLLSLLSMILPSYLPYAVPTSLLFGVLVTFGRMSGDGEIVAIRASGVSVPRLLPPVFALSTIACLLPAYLVFEVEPHSRQQMKVLVRQLATSVKVFPPGRFRALGNRTIYVDQLGDEACPLRGVLIGDFGDPRRTFYVSAQCGAIAESAELDRISLKLTDGSIHLSESESGRYRKIQFVEMSTEIDLTQYIRPMRRPRDYTLTELFALDAMFEAGQKPQIRGKGGRRSVEVQIQRRLALPFAPIVLAFLSVPLGIRPVRSGRSAGALTAIAVMALYWCLFSAGKIAAEEIRWLPPVLALWIPNFLIAALGYFLLRRTIRSDS